MRPVVTTAATAASALLLALAFPNTSWQPLAFVALAPLFVTLRSVGMAAAIGLAWLWTILFSLGVASALPRAVETYFLQPPLASFGFAMFVWTFTAAIYFMAFAATYRALGRRASALAVPLLAAAAWAGCEVLRGRLANTSELFAANPWGLVAYSQVGFDALVQVAALTGVYGVSFCVVGVNAAAAELALAYRRERRLPRNALVGAALAVVPALAALLYGAVVLRNAPSAEPEGGTPIAVIQPNLAVGSQWSSSAHGAHLEEQLRLTLRAAEMGAPRIAFWPESSLTFFLELEPAYQRAIASVLAYSRLELVVGGPRVADPDAKDPDYFNSVFALDAGGAIRGRYDKQQLVPFAEFLPLRRFDFLRRRFERVRVFRHGAPSSPLPTSAGPAGILVCNEAMYPEVARARAREGATYLVNPSNDTWVQSAVWADRMFDLVSLRAVEQRRFLVRASTAGPSAIVDPWGRVQRRTSTFEATYLLGRIAPRHELSLYARVGDAFGWACIAAVGLALLRASVVVSRP
jgi:apolipoprotein N-acyltransferase